MTREVIRLNWEEPEKASEPLRFEPDEELAAVIAKWMQPAEELKMATVAIVDPGKYSSVDVRSGPNSYATLMASILRERSGPAGIVVVFRVAGAKSLDPGYENTCWSPVVL